MMCPSTRVNDVESVSLALSRVPGSRSSFLEVTIPAECGCVAAILTPAWRKIFQGGLRLPTTVSYFRQMCAFHATRGQHPSPPLHLALHGFTAETNRQASSTATSATPAQNGWSQKHLFP